jgi:thimet oligopeptidase
LHASWDDARARELLAEIKAAPSPRTEANTLEPYDRLRTLVEDAAALASVVQNVHPDPAAREHAEGIERQVLAFSTDLGLDRELFEAFRAVDTAPLEARARRLVERMLRDFRRAGVGRDEATRRRLKELADLQVELSQTHSRNIRDDVRSVKLDPAELDGLPDDYRAAHPPGADGKVTITTDYPDYIPFRTYARSGRARRELFVAYMNRAWPANVEVLRKLLEARREQAKLLGYAHWGDYVTADKMIGSAARVREFVDRIGEMARPYAERDMARILERKRRDDPAARAVDQSENVYYEELVKRERFAFDSQEVRPYFPFAGVLEGLLTVTARIFEVSYRPVEAPERWHESVRVYDVWRASERLGRIYLDMHPREGKYKHAAQFSVTNGVLGRQLPEGALVCNFPETLLEHDDVVTMFHEFGHLVHHVLGGHQRWVTQSGVTTEWDFVEAPSQMLEEWAWDHETLASFAHHHQTGEAIPRELVERMRAAHDFGKGAHARHQMFYSAMSLTYHIAEDPASIDLDAVMGELQRRYSPYGYVPDTHMHASFGHLVGYSAMYYTYMWSLVIAKDLFSAFESRGLYDPDVCRRYGESILAPGGSKDAADLVKDFLGRPFDIASYQRWLER